MKPYGRIDEEHGAVDVLVLAQFREDRLDYVLVDRQRRLEVEKSFGFRTGRSVKPDPHVVDLDHGVVNSNVIWMRPIGGPSIGFFAPTYGP